MQVRGHLRIVKKKKKKHPTMGVIQRFGPRCLDLLRLASSLKFTAPVQMNAGILATARAIFIWRFSISISDFRSSISGIKRV